MIPTVIMPETFGFEPASTGTVIVYLMIFLIWRIGFLLYSGKRGSLKEGGFADHLYYCLPVYGGTHVPFGKGHDYLASKQSDSREKLSRSQLAGLKLFILVWLWTGVRELFAIFVYGESGPRTGISSAICLGLFHIEDIITVNAPALSVSWASLILDMIDQTLDLAVKGHFIVGTLRLFGYNVFRNTYKPLLATSIVDF